MSQENPFVIKFSDEDIQRLADNPDSVFELVPARVGYRVFVDSWDPSTRTMIAHYEPVTSAPSTETP